MTAAGTTARRWTKARREGLLALALADAKRRPLRISNHNSTVSIYWQTADWLSKAGLASIVAVDVLWITPDGRKVAQEISS